MSNLQLSPHPPREGAEIHQLTDEIMRLLRGDEPHEPWSWVRKFVPDNQNWWKAGGSINKARCAIAVGHLTGMVDEHHVRLFLENEAEVGFCWTEPGGYVNEHTLAMVALRDAPGAARWWKWFMALSNLHYVPETGHIVMARTRAAMGPREVTHEVIFALLSDEPGQVLDEPGTNRESFWKDRSGYGAQAVRAFKLELWDAMEFPIPLRHGEEVPMLWPMHFQRLKGRGWVSYFPRLGGYDHHVPAAVWDDGAEFFAYKKGAPGGRSKALVGFDAEGSWVVSGRAGGKPFSFPIPKPTGDPIIIGTATDTPAPPEPEEPSEPGWPPPPLGPRDRHSFLSKARAHIEALAEGREGEHLRHARSNLAAWERTR